MRAAGLGAARGAGRGLRGCVGPVDGCDPPWNGGGLWESLGIPCPPIYPVWGGQLGHERAPGLLRRKRRPSGSWGSRSATAEPCPVPGCVHLGWHSRYRRCGAAAPTGDSMAPCSAPCARGQATLLPPLPSGSLLCQDLGECRGALQEPQPLGGGGIPGSPGQEAGCCPGLGHSGLRGLRGDVPLCRDMACLALPRGAGAWAGTHRQLRGLGLCRCSLQRGAGCAPEG